MKLAGFVFGAALGAGIAVLLAPKTGKEMRNQLFTGTDWNEQRERLHRGGQRRSRAGHGSFRRPQAQDRRDALAPAQADGGRTAPALTPARRAARAAAALCAAAALALCYLLYESQWLRVVAARPARRRPAARPRGLHHRAALRPARRLAPQLQPARHPQGDRRHAPRRPRPHRRHRRPRDRRLAPRRALRRAAPAAGLARRLCRAGQPRPRRDQAAARRGGRPLAAWASTACGC